MEKLPRDFRDFLSLLNSHCVEYLLVGGYAVAIHGYIPDILGTLISGSPSQMKMLSAW